MIERWLHNEIAASYDGMKSDPSRAVSVDSAFASVRNGLVISWSLGTRPDAELVNMMLDAAIETVRGTDERPIVHSDWGAHYRWPGWLSRISDAKLVRSMSRRLVPQITLHANASSEG